MLYEKIRAKEEGIYLHIERLSKTIIFSIRRGQETLASAEIDNWKAVLIIKLFGADAPAILSGGKPVDGRED